MTDPSAQRRAVLRDAAGLGVAVGAYGLSFGAIAVAAGLSVPQASVLSLAGFTGASQFALVGVLGAGGGAVSGTATALLLGSRNLLYALRLSTLLQVRGPRRLLAAQLVIDETTAMALAHEHDGRDGAGDREHGQPRGSTEPPYGQPASGQPAYGRLAFWATGAAVYLCWNLATVVGALGARLLGRPETLGLDAAFPAAFLALLAPRLAGSRERLVALGAVAVALATVPVTPGGAPVLLAALVAAAGLRRPRSEGAA